MATPKMWTADDLKMGVMRASVKDGNLSIIQGYSFIDGSGDIIEELPKRSVMETTEFATLPLAIQTALINLRNYMYNKALVKEGME